MAQLTLCRLCALFGTSRQSLEDTRLMVCGVALMEDEDVILGLSQFAASARLACRWNYNLNGCTEVKMWIRLRSGTSILKTLTKPPFRSANLKFEYLKWYKIDMHTVFHSGEGTREAGAGLKTAYLPCIILVHIKRTIYVVYFNISFLSWLLNGYAI